jgi:hypothetical protein
VPDDDGGAATLSIILERHTLARARVVDCAITPEYKILIPKSIAVVEGDMSPVIRHATGNIQTFARARVVDCAITPEYKILLLLFFLLLPPLFFLLLLPLFLLLLPLFFLLLLPLFFLLLPLFFLLLLPSSFSFFLLLPLFFLLLPPRFLSALLAEEFHSRIAAAPEEAVFE